MVGSSARLPSERPIPYSNRSHGFPQGTLPTPGATASSEIHLPLEPAFQSIPRASWCLFSNFLCFPPRKLTLEVGEMEESEICLV